MRYEKHLLATILVIVGSVQWAAAAAAEKPEPPPIVPVQRGLLRIAVRSVGIVVPASDVPIVARAAGEITSLPVELGQVVKKGQRLLEVEPGDAKLALDQARAEWLEAQAQRRMAQLRLAMAERDLERAETIGRAVATTYTVELQRQELAAREAATSRTVAALETARANLAKTRLLSPMDGVITECLVRRGEVIAPGAVEAGTRLMTVSDLSRLSLITEIDESQIHDVQPNLAATVMLPAFPERRFQGRVVSISPRGQNRNGRTVFPLRIDLEGDPGDAGRVGLTANVEIVAIEKPDALLLENRAIRLAGAPTVVVLEKGQMREQKVRLGRSDGVRVEILEGLREGDQVVLPPAPPPPTPTPAKR